MFGYPWWLVLFAGIGLFAIGGAIVSLFFALGRRPARMWSNDVPPITANDWVRPVAALLNAPVRKGGRARLLNNGDAFMTALMADIEAAQRTIAFMVYIWEPGRMSDIIMEALTRRASEGVQVRILLDGLGGMRAPDESMDRFRAAGGRVEHFRKPSFGKLTRFHRRNHRRAIVFDGRVAYTGGMAVGDKWLGDARNQDEWRDTMVRVTGWLAESLQSAFSELWAFCSGEVLTGEDVFPEHPEDEDCDAVSFSIISSPSSEEHPLRVFYFLTFLAARERLWITTPYFVPDKHTRNVVKQRARAGVDVRILMPDEHTDAAPIRQASRSYYQEMMDAGVRIYEYNRTMIHAKHVVVDSRWSVVGSANMDIRSKELNEENVLGILENGLAAELEAAFLKDLAHATEIDRVAWQRRGLGARLIERFCVLFAEQY